MMSCGSSLTANGQRLWAGGRPWGTARGRVGKAASAELSPQRLDESLELLPGARRAAGEQAHLGQGDPRVR
jgi:hypothetical protein